MMEELVGGRYQIVTKLSSGRFCQTYLAEDRHQFQHKCVVKRLQPLSPSRETWSKATQLFQREAQTQYRLGHHPQIPQLLAYLQEKQEFYLVQELIEGHDLREELAPGKQLSESEVIALLQDILEPLAFVHQQQVIHRDLKPPNLIRRDQDHKIALIDFGAVQELAVTKVLNPQGETTIVTTIGTPGYMPSEQSTGKARLSSDIYAVGIIGIQALTGKMPQELEEDPETAEIIWREQIQVSSKLGKVLDKMVRYDFRERYRSAGEALEALKLLTKKKFLSPLAKENKIISTQSKKLSLTQVLSAAGQKLSGIAGMATAVILIGLGGWYAEQQLPKYIRLRKIQENKQIGNYAKCINLFRALIKYPAISARQKTGQQECQNLQVRSYLLKALQLAGEKKSEQAWVDFNWIAPDTSSPPQVQALLVQWNPTNYEFYAHYQRALDYMKQSKYSSALESLYLAAEQAMIDGQSTLLLPEIFKPESGNFQSVAQEAKQWQLLKDNLLRAEYP